MKKYLTFYVDSQCGGGSEEMRLWDTKEKALDALVESGGERWYMTGLELHELDTDSNTVKDLKAAGK
jgi:hypothetical protein